ncbi:MAG: phosphatase PAP2 family protein [Floccifex sp.]
MIKMICIFNKTLTLCMYIIYPCFLIYIWNNPFLIKAICIPLISFILVSIVRKKINRPRPYEINNKTPIIKKDTKGQSMPSRHVFSSVIISMTILYIYPGFGIFLLILSAIEAFIRVIGGVHFISDVVAGYIIGILVGLLYFF